MNFTSQHNVIQCLLPQSASRSIMRHKCSRLVSNFAVPFKDCVWLGVPSVFVHRVLTGLGSCEQSSRRRRRNKTDNNSRSRWIDPEQANRGKGPTPTAPVAPHVAAAVEEAATALEPIVVVTATMLYESPNGDVQ